MLVERIGTAAMLEQTAEECAELSQACLKASRLLRGENPVYKEYEQLEDNLHEEVADVNICLNELEMGKILNMNHVNKWVSEKVRRMIRRLGEEKIKQLQENQVRRKNENIHEGDKG